jgi:hypothetical protein
MSIKVDEKAHTQGDALGSFCFQLLAVERQQAGFEIKLYYNIFSTKSQ